MKTKINSTEADFVRAVFVGMESTGDFLKSFPEFETFLDELPLPETSIPEALMSLVCDEVAILRRLPLGSFTAIKYKGEK